MRLKIRHGHDAGQVYGWWRASPVANKWRLSEDAIAQVIDPNDTIIIGDRQLRTVRRDGQSVYCGRIVNRKDTLIDAII
jgi:hypothetical protein